MHHHQLMQIVLTRYTALHILKMGLSVGEVDDCAASMTDQTKGASTTRPAMQAMETQLLSSSASQAGKKHCVVSRDNSDRPKTQHKRSSALLLLALARKPLLGVSFPTSPNYAAAAQRRAVQRSAPPIHRPRALRYAHIPSQCVPKGGAPSMVGPAPPAPPVGGGAPAPAPGMPPAPGKPPSGAPPAPTCVTSTTRFSFGPASRN